MRLIDADKLKRRAQRVATEAWKMKTTASVETILNQFIDWIDEAETIETMQDWIPCSERLPKTDNWRTEYIVTYRYGYKDLISDTTCMSWENTTVRGKPVSRWIWHGTLSPWKVVAWMEKPKPWEGEGNV